MNFSKIGMVAQDHGAPTHVQMDPRKAVSWVAENVVPLQGEELRIYDEARADLHGEDAGELPAVQSQLDKALELLSELRDGSGMSQEQKDRYDRLVNGEPEPNPLDRCEQILRDHEGDLQWGDLQAFLRVKYMVEMIAQQPFWNEEDDQGGHGMEGMGVSRDWQEARENEAQDWIETFRTVLDINPGYKELS